MGTQTSRIRMGSHKIGLRAFNPLEALTTQTTEHPAGRNEGHRVIKVK